MIMEQSYKKRDKGKEKLCLPDKTTKKPKPCYSLANVYWKSGSAAEQQLHFSKKE